MLKVRCLFILVFLLLSSCTLFTEDYDLQQEQTLKKAYADCMAKSSNNPSNCKQQKDRMLEVEEWNKMDDGE